MSIQSSANTQVAALVVMIGWLAAGALGCSQGTSPPVDAGTDAGQQDAQVQDGGDRPDASDPGPGDQPGDPVPDAGDPGPVGLPEYNQFVLQARCNLSQNPSGAFNLDPDHLLSSEDVVQNDQGQVAFRLTATPDGSKEIWLGQAGQGTVVYQSPVDAFMSPLAMNDAGLILFDLSFVTTEGLYYFDGSNQESGLWSTEPLGAQGRGGIRVNDQGMAGFRADFGNGHAYVVTDGQTSSVVAREMALDGASPYSFLFTPDFNQENQLAGQARLGPGDGDERPDEIRLWNQDGTSMRIAGDRDADPRSPYLAFDSTRPALNDRGQVAFIASLENDVRGVFLSDGDSTLTIATSEARDISEIEYFGPDVNNQGLVVFRATTGLGLRAIWAGNGEDLVQVINEHDPIDTDLGTGRIDQHDPAYPVFGGTPAINNRGDVVFTAGLTPPDDDQVEWGTGVFTAVAE